MKQSSLFTTTLRTAPADETSKNAIFLTRGGYVQKTMAGVYSYLPLGLRVIQNISAIVREELNALPYTSEVLMSALQPKELWEETGRWTAAVGDVMYTTAEDKVGLGPTHEEVATDIFRSHVQSYRSVPTAYYQIQTKFRKELRAKSGLLRGRELLMKDLYSFHLDQAEFNEYYEQVAQAYLRIFKRCGVQALYVEAAGGMFSDRSDEFQVITEVGEDTIYLSADGLRGKNQEIVADPSSQELIDYCGGEVRTAKAVEVGNIFPLSDRFTSAMGANVLLDSGESFSPIMGCYGLGVSRLVGVLVEVLGSESKMVWPEAIAPFKVHIIDLLKDGSAERMYDQIKAKGMSVLLDDRVVRPGEAFADADFIGAPVRVVVSTRAQAAGGVEVQRGGETTVIAEADFLASM